MLRISGMTVLGTVNAAHFRDDGAGYEERHSPNYRRHSRAGGNLHVTFDLKHTNGWNAENKRDPGQCCAFPG